MSAERRADFQRNELLEALLTDLNRDLRPAEATVAARYRNKPMAWPVVLVMGSLRSGTTLFMQWLAQSGLFAYPSNFLSRFYAVPIIGARIQLMLTDPRFRFRDEFESIAASIDYRSDNGKTSGLLGPNEFWYFWRRFLPEPERDVWSDAELESAMDTGALRAELVGLMDVFGKPLAAKGLLFNYNIPFLDSALENVVFVHVEREPVANVASVLEARERQFGDRAQWYSFEIPEYAELKHRGPIEQAAGQVACINRAVTEGLAAVAGHRRLHVGYEAFCADPRAVFDELLDKVGLDPLRYGGPERFEPSRSGAIADAAAIEAALKKYR